jgi:hypothetical protein
MKKRHLVGLFFLVLWLTATVAGAQRIVQSRGFDSRVDYVELGEYGAWDDRNYALSQDDLALLPENEDERSSGVPLFYRVEMLKASPVLRQPDRRYPRSALNIFYLRYGGFLVEGKLYRHVEVEGDRILVDADKGVEQEAFETYGPSAFGKINGWNVKPLSIGAETAVKIKPGAPNIAVAGINHPTGGQAMAFSSTGGRLWTLASGADPLPETCCDPTVDWSSDGADAYAASLADGDVFVYRSADNGQSWDDLPGGRTEMGEADGFVDKEFLHIDKHPGSPFVDRVYLCWHIDNVQRFAVSSDRAETFTKLTVARNSQQIGVGCDVTTDKDGRVLYFWPAFNSRRILVRASTNGGASFLKTRQIAKTQGSFDFPIPVMHQRNAFIYVTADTDLSDGQYGNRVYAAWTDSYERDNDNQPARNHARIRVGYSDDGGETWTIRSPHPTNDGDSVDRFHPWLAVNEQGVVHLIYYSTERTGNRRGADVIHAVSKNGGQGWTQRRVNADVITRVDDGFQFGDYNGLDATAARLLATWTGNDDDGEAAGQAGRRNDPP